MKRIFTLFLGILLFSCTQKSHTEDINQQLKSAMESYLSADPHSKDKYQYDVKEVTFFEETSYYICEFKVHMKTVDKAINAPKVDTTGGMKVKIDKNFKVISRYY
jgi:hypothetical protein